ncbi:MAG: hypothetical protein AB1791_08960 [Chloroflexota bacterium]
MVVNRRRLRRQFRSYVRLYLAQWRVWVRRPPLPAAALIASPTLLPRPIYSPLRRLATAVAAIGLVLLALTVTALQSSQLVTVGAQDSPPVAQASATVDYRPLVADHQLPPPVPKLANPALLSPLPTPTPSPTPPPAPAAQGGSVAFTIFQNGQSDLYALPAGYAQPVRLTSHPADDRDPAWSPDGRQLAFTSHRDGNWEIYLLNLGKGRLRRLTHDLAYDGHPAWSPDGQWLVYESYQEGNLDLYLLPADGHRPPLRLTYDPAPDFNPAWSPGDGRTIAFTSWRTGNPDIFFLSLDVGTDERVVNVTASPAGVEDQPAFSSDGRWLAYSEGRGGYDLVYAIPLVDGGVAGPLVSVGQGQHPAWSPAGPAMVYVHQQDEQSFLLAGSATSWGIAPQVYVGSALLDGPTWTAASLPPNLIEVWPEAAVTDDPPLFVDVIATPQASGPPYLLWEVPVQAPAAYLSDRVDQSFLALRERVIREASWDFLGQVDKLYEPLNARPLPGQSDQTWNKAGRAFDFAQQLALADDPQVEIVREDRGTEVYWRVYLRAAVQDGSLGEPLRRLPWDFRARYGANATDYDQGGRLRAAIPAGYYVDFTALAAYYGWQRLAAAGDWRTFFPGIQYWHFENRQGLTWEEAMLELYTAEEMMNDE